MCGWEVEQKHTLLVVILDDWEYCGGVGEVLGGNASNGVCFYVRQLEYSARVGDEVFDSSQVVDLVDEVVGFTRG